MNDLGLAGTAFEQEVRSVLAAGDTLTFIPSVPRRRTDDEELFST